MVYCVWTLLLNVAGSASEYRLLLTVNGFQYGPVAVFAFIIDVLLVPVSFNTQTCFQLYQEPFMPSSDKEVGWYRPCCCN